jgi:hypothetical protein
MAVLGSPASVESTGEGRGIGSDEEHAPNTTPTGTTPAWRSRLLVHPASDLFPMLDDAGLDELAADIKAGVDQKLIHAITLWSPSPESTEYMLLDGRNRASALERLGLSVLKEDGTPNWKYCRTVGADSSFDPVAFIISANLKRRHLDTSQRAMVAAKLANLKKGGAGGSTIMSDTANAVSQAEAAKLLNVSTDSVQRAGTALREGPPELVEQVQRGQVTVSAAAKSIKAAKAGPKEAQRRALREKAALAPGKQPEHGPKVPAGTERALLIDDVCKWLRRDLHDAIDSLERILRDEQSHIEALPREKRVSWALGILQTLGVTVDDLEGAI